VATGPCARFSLRRKKIRRQPCAGRYFRLFFSASTHLSTLLPLFFHLHLCTFSFIPSSLSSLPAVALLPSRLNSRSLVAEHVLKPFPSSLSPRPTGFLRRVDHVLRRRIPAWRRRILERVRLRLTSPWILPAKPSYRSSFQLFGVGVWCDEVKGKAGSLSRPHDLRLQRRGKISIPSYHLMFNCMTDSGLDTAVATATPTVAAMVVVVATAVATVAAAAATVVATAVAMEATECPTSALASRSKTGVCYN
jgi:hypothetical protein